MVIIQSKSGRLANRLFIFSRFMANAIEYGHALANPTFDEYCEYFPRTRQNNFGDYPISVKLSAKLPYTIFFPATYLLKKVKPSGKKYIFLRSEKAPFYDLNTPEFIDNAREKAVFASGWFFNDRQNLIKHNDKIREFFSPDAEVMDSISNSFTNIRKSADVVVGVHIRRGDYRRWQGGIYFFDDHEYADRMQKVENQLKQQGKNVVFFLCSNEPVLQENFRRFSIVKGPGNMIGDLYSLAACDYIIGPPSTYSMWAAFYGQKKLFHIRPETQLMELDAFYTLYE